MSMMGELNLFIGLQIKQTQDRTYVHQGKYTKNVLKSSTWVRISLFWRLCSPRRRLMPMRTTSPWTRRSKGAWLALSCTWLRRGQTYTLQCVCALVSRNSHAHLTDRLWSRLWGTWFSLLSLVCGTPLCPFCLCAVTLMLILQVGVWSASLLLGLVSFLGLHWFPGLHASSLAWLSLPLRLNMLLSLAIARSCYWWCLLYSILAWIFIMCLCFAIARVP